jgi:hypothetical protein
MIVKGASSALRTRCEPFESQGFPAFADEHESAPGNVGGATRIVEFDAPAGGEAFALHVAGGAYIDEDVIARRDAFRHRIPAPHQHLLAADDGELNVRVARGQEDAAIGLSPASR